MGGSVLGELYKRSGEPKKVAQINIRKLLRDAARAKSTDERKQKRASAKSAQTRWNNEHPKDQIYILP
jgi:hypothetical protein